MPLSLGDAGEGAEGGGGEGDEGEQSWEAMRWRGGWLEDDAKERMRGWRRGRTELKGKGKRRVE